jgi:hypothetical protein
MRGRRSSLRIETDLDGTIELQRTKDTMKCFIRNINEECVGVMIVTGDPRVCAKEDVNLSIFIPAERSPVKCSGRIVWHSSADGAALQGVVGYVAGVFITDISRLDRRRLELLVARRKAFLGGGIESGNDRDFWDPKESNPGSPEV